MAKRKWFEGKECPYCGREGCSTLGEHVVSRKFFLERDRGNLPKVPACNDCNTAKSQLESYVLAVMPFANRHDDCREYAQEHLNKRLRGNNKLADQLMRGVTPSLESTGGILVETGSMNIDFSIFKQWLTMIVKGLYRFHFKVTLSKNTLISIKNYLPDRESEVFTDVYRQLGLDIAHINNSLGRGTFDYELYRSNAYTQNTMWRFRLFGDARFVATDEVAKGIDLTSIMAFTYPPPQSRYDGFSWSRVIG